MGRELWRDTEPSAWMRRAPLVRALEPGAGAGQVLGGRLATSSASFHVDILGITVALPGSRRFQTPLTCLQSCPGRGNGPGPGPAEMGSGWLRVEGPGSAIRAEKSTPASLEPGAPM